MPSFYNNILKDNGFYVVPGLKKTETSRKISSNKYEPGVSASMDPQGVTSTDNYILISAYSHDKKYNSVIYVFNKQTGNYIKTIVLDGIPHIGGIAYDDKNKKIWFCDNQENAKNGRVSSISLSAINNYNFRQNFKPIKYTESVNLLETRKASFIAINKNTLVVGDFFKKSEGQLYGYAINHKSSISQKSNHHVMVRDDADVFDDQIEPEIQGVTFYNNQIIFSQSYGSKNSKILVYNDYDKDKLFLNADLKKEITVPPYLEQISFDGTSCLMVFESATQKFRNNERIIKIDHILRLNHKAFE
ncbi:YncE family protein [Leuconostoc palmae]|uniref:YncE family protein n=1 Tax=Leuconostoc palmae TaxID=501487 RepID=UPI001C7E07BC|nr:hypothetical protein [Leuconostoc palmae]